jgi:hypothetical protein
MDFSDPDWTAGIIIRSADDPWLAKKESEYFRDRVQNLDTTGLFYLFQGGSAIERGQELRYVPRKIFQEYIQYFVGYLLSDLSTGDPDAPSVFIWLVKERENRDPGCVTQILHLISPCLERISQSQIRFDADEEIYGNFPEQVATTLVFLQGS